MSGIAGTITLYEVGTGFRELEDYLLALEGDVSDTEIEAEVVRRFSELELTRNQKLEGYGMLLKNLAARSQIRKEEGARLTKLGKADETAEKRLKTHLLQIFEMFGWEDEVQTNRFKFKPVNNGGNLPIELAAEYAENPELLPEEFRTVTYKPNLETIRRALQAEESLPFAKFGERGKSIKIS